MSNERLTVERREGVLLVGINRPEKRNALDEAMVNEFHAVLTEAAREPSILVLHSTTPGMFVSGADIAELLDRDANAAMRGIISGMVSRLCNHRWPTIAVIDGDALGGGCELALACDFRICSDRSRFAQPELGLGILAGAGANFRLPQLVGVRWARRMLYTGELLAAERALEIGLVDWVHSSEEVIGAACDLAGVIAKRSFQALELTKLALRINTPETTIFDMTAQAILFESDEKRQRMRAFLDRRKRNA